jgi:hypothetical protein
LPLSLSPTNLGDHRLLLDASTEHERKVVHVNAERLDDALRGRELPRPIVMKVDTQGAEVRVFEGASETLQRVDYLVTEYWREGIVAHGESAARFWELMRRFRFGAVLHVLPLPEPLNGSDYVFDQLNWLMKDESDPGFFDLLFSRHWVLPKSSPEHDQLKATWEAELAAGR